VRRDQLLLLTHGVHEPQGVGAEADQTHGPEREEAQPRADRHLQTPAWLRVGEREKGQEEPGGDLDPHARDHRGRGGAQPRAGADRERQCGGERQQDQGVVVCAADRQLEQHRVQADERRRPAGRVTEPPCGPRDQRYSAEARGDRYGLEGPQPAGEPQRRRRIACEREQRAIRGVQVGPSDEREDRVGWRFGRHMRVGVKAMQGTQAGEAQIAEDVLGDQRRAQEQDDVRRHDRRHERTRGQRPGSEQHEQIARAHDQHERLEAAFGDAHAQILQRTCHPARPAAVAARHILRGRGGDAGGQQEDRRQHPEQAERTQCPRHARLSWRAGSGICALGPPRGSVQEGCGGCGLYGLIVTSRRPASVDPPGKL
jgi:hypothetical protein